jgi:WD40 repeat protein
MRLKLQNVLICILLMLMLSATYVSAQDTPAPIRDAAIADLNTRLPGIGRPDGWQHSLENSSDRNLNCPLMGLGGALTAQVQVYVLTLFYGNTSYVYRVSADASIVVACDQQLLQPSASTTPPTLAPSTCTDAVRLKTSLVPRDRARVSASSLGVYRLADFTSTAITTLNNGTEVTILDGPDCDDRALWWFVDYGGARGYLPEYDYINNVYYLSRVVNTTPQAPGVITPQASTAFNSATCPANFQGYAQPRLYVGATGRVETGGVNNIMRQSYGRSSQPAGAEIPPGGVFTVVGGPECTGAQLNEAILWWQVNYNGVTGWTAESLNGDYFLELDPNSQTTVNVEPTPNIAFPQGTPIDPATLPTTTLPGQNRVAITLANVGQVRQVGALEALPDSIVRLDVSEMGVVAVYMSGMNILNNIVFFESLNGSNLMPADQWPLVDNSQLLALSPFGDLFATSEVTGSAFDRSVFAYSIRPLATQAEIPLPVSEIYAAAFSTDSSLLAYSHVTNPGPAGTPKFSVYNFTSKLSTELAVTGPILDAEFSQDDARLLAVEVNGKITIWDAGTLQPLGAFTAMVGASRLAISPDGNRVAVGGSGRTVQIWNISNPVQAVMERELTVSFDQVATYEIGDMAFNEDGTLLAAGGYIVPMADNVDNPVLLFDVASGNQVATLIGLEKVMGLGFSQGGSILVAHGEYDILFFGIPQP